MNNSDEINYFFKNNYQNKIGIFVKRITKVFMRWKNWSDLKGLHSMNFWEEDWSKIRTLFMNSRPEVRNYRMKLIDWMIREFFKDAESVLTGLSHVPSQPALLPPFRVPGGMLSRSVGLLSRNDKPPDVWDTHGISGNVFANPPGSSSSSPNPGGVNPWISNVTEHTSPHVTSERQTPVQDPRCQSGPSARNSFDPNEGDSSKNYGADQPRLQISDPHFTNSLHQQHLLAGR